jgi:hypothetical protein
MIDHQFESPEREIIKFRVMSLKDKVAALQIGELIITNLRVMFKQIIRVVKYPILFFFIETISK